MSCGFLVLRTDAKSKFLPTATTCFEHVPVPLETLQKLVGGFVVPCHAHIRSSVKTECPLRWGALNNQETGLDGPILLANLVREDGAEATDDDEDLDFGTWTLNEAQAVCRWIAGGSRPPNPPNPPSR